MTTKNIVIDRLLGSSRLSEVFQVQIEERVYALKKVRLSEHYAILKREFNCLNTLHHPNIVKVHQWFDDIDSKGCPAFTMTKLNGINGKVFAERLQRLPPNERHKRILQIGIQLCSALSHLHQKGWLHRDVKPSNLMFEQESELLLIDFGTVIAHSQTNSPSTGLVGTPRYAAPEQLSGSTLSPACDQFSLGATLYYLLLNRRPFKDRDRTLPIKPVIIDPSVPIHLSDILMRCMSEHPSNRFSSLQKLGQTLASVQPTDQPLAGREPVIEEIASCIQRVHRGEQVYVQFTGTQGSGKRWAQKTLCDAARIQGIHVLVLNDSDSIDTVLNQLASRTPMIVCSSSSCPPRLGIGAVEIVTHWLSLSEIRRSLFSHAPKTPNLTIKAQWLHEQSNGIPALLVPLLMDYTIHDAFHIPQEPELLVPKEWFANLTDAQISALQLIGQQGGQGVNFDVLHSTIASIALPELNELVDRSLLIQTGSTWRLSCLLIATYIQHHYPIDEQQQKQWQALTQPLSLVAPSAISDIDETSAKGHLAKAKKQGESLLSTLPDKERAACLVQLGQVHLDIGNHKEAAKLLADATALSSTVSFGEKSQKLSIYLRSQALRARASLEQHNGSPIGAMHALDRLSKVIKLHDPWVNSVWQWALGALGDKRQWNAHLYTALSAQTQNRDSHDIRCHFNILRGACAIGELDYAQQLIDELSINCDKFPLLAWEISRVQSLLQTSPPPKVGTLVYDLSIEDIFLFKRRWVRVKGKHPDPTWHY